MTLEEAKNILNDSVRQELRDHAFGDVEVSWIWDGIEVANGYFGGSASNVSFAFGEFTGPEAWELRNCGTLGAVERNDETGPEAYQEGRCMPALTLAGVREELTRKG
jgi:hypothetical protein